jgi:hypothetical protein
MSGSQIGLAILIGALVTSLADWFFMAVLFHEKYKTYPEIWRRPRGERGEGAAIGISALVALLTPCAFVVGSHQLGITTIRGQFILALMSFLIGPVPVIVGNYLFIKLHPGILAAHLLGWLVKLLALAAVLSAMMK